MNDPKLKQKGSLLSKIYVKNFFQKSPRPILLITDLVTKKLNAIFPPMFHMYKQTRRKWTSAETPEFGIVDWMVYEF